MKKSILITGGLGLLGGAVSKHLFELGYHVIVVDLDHDPNIGPDIDYICHDLMDFDAYHVLKKKVQRLTSNLKVIINNAAYNPKVEGGASAFGRFENQCFEELSNEMKLNVFAPLKLIQTLLDVFNKDNETGNCKIINVASTYGLVPPNQNLYKELSAETGRDIVKPIGYPITKAALIMATKYLAIYLGDKGFNVNAIAPGGIENGQPPVFVKEYERYTPMKRMANVEDMLGAFELLCGSKSEYISGHTLTVDGGWTVW